MRAETKTLVEQWAEHQVHLSSRFLIDTASNVGRPCCRENRNPNGARNRNQQTEGGNRHDVFPGNPALAL